MLCNRYVLRSQRTYSLVTPWRRVILNSTIGKTYRSHNSRRPAVVVSALISVLALGVCTVVAETSGKGQKKGKGGKRKKEAVSPTATASGSPGSDQSLTNIPLPVGHDAKGLVLPDFDAQGRLRGKFVAGSAKRIDENHIDFNDLKITTFTPDNQVDMQIQMTTSTFDLTTKILSSKERTTVTRHDFNVIGDTAMFDTNARTSRMVGNVKMVITSQPEQAEKPQP